MIYFDNAATSWPKPETVYQAVDQCLRSVSGNPGRGFSEGARNAASILYETREELAELFGSSNPSQIVFTHNATDALNMALFGTINPGDRIITTVMEHNAVVRPLRYLESIGVKVVKIPADQEGRIQLECLRQEAAKGAKAIVLSHASNVTGTIMPLEEIGKIAQKQQTLLIVDAAQTAGLEAIDVVKMNIGLLAFSGHKSLLGPQGTGGLYIREKLTVKPMRFGGTGSLSESEEQPGFLPDRLESGTMNTPGIAGLLEGLRFIKRTGRDTIKQKETTLAVLLIEGLKKIPRVKVYGPVNQRERTAVISFTIADLDSSRVAYELDQKFGIACRGGLHCAPWAHKTIGTSESGTIRFSPGFFNHEHETAAALKAVQIIAERNEKHEGNSG